MRYKVIISQSGASEYRTDDIVSSFDDLAKLFVFIEMVFESCMNIKVNIEPITDKEGEE